MTVRQSKPVAPMVDPSRTIAQIDEKIAATGNPRHRALLENWREHVIAEVAGDIEAIMKTQVAEPRYHFWGGGTGDRGPKGGAAVRAYYQELFDQGANTLQHDFDRIVVDDHHVCFDGPIRIIMPGTRLRKMGVPVDDPDARYVYSYQAANVFYYDDDGNCLGEDAYSDLPKTLDAVHKLAPEGR